MLELATLRYVLSTKGSQKYPSKHSKKDYSSHDMHTLNLCTIKWYSIINHSGHQGQRNWVNQVGPHNVVRFSCITYLFFLFFSAPSGYFGHVKTKLHGRELSHFRQHCDLKVPSLMISNDKMTSDMWTESQASYRLVYELILPFLLPIILLGKK